MPREQLRKKKKLGAITFITGIVQFVRSIPIFSVICSVANFPEILPSMPSVFLQGDILVPASSYFLP